MSYEGGVNKRKMIAGDVRMENGVSVGVSEKIYWCTKCQNSKICPVKVMKNLRIGKNGKIFSHSSLCEGLINKDYACIGHGVPFTNYRFPGASLPEPKGVAAYLIISTVDKRRASIGSATTTLCGNTIVPAGSMGTENGAQGTIVAGNPARF